MRHCINILKQFTLLFSSLIILSACDGDLDHYVGLTLLNNEKEKYFESHPLRVRHTDARLKILAIGNSFTNNSTLYLPWMANTLDADSICFAKLYQSGASLKMHWSNHCKKSSEYTMHYSDHGEWVSTDIASIDDALNILEWDIIVIQQASYNSGHYSTFQPALDFLVALFRESNPKVQIAFNYTWAYFPWATHQYFDDFNKDTDLMYDAIMNACGMASENLDLKILSATLVRDMRLKFAEEEETFSTDGMHITNPLLQYALSSLWYESLVTPKIATSCLTVTDYPDNLESDKVAVAKEIIENILK